MFLIFQKIGLARLLGARRPASHVCRSGTVTAIALLFFLGAMGKSAQFPLHIWLPDAMEGPTPVSALIHAATMVTAGVFLDRAARTCSSTSRPHGRHADRGRGSARSPRCARRPSRSCRTTSRRCSRTRRSASSATCSSRSASARTAPAIFHMVTHAFFKALLFLGAGSVIHGMHDEQDMRKMGGLRKFMPITAVTFIVGWLAIAGIFPFAGFWSKDEILAKAWCAPQLRAVGRRRRRRAVHRVLHDPPGVARLLRPRTIPRRRGTLSRRGRRPQRRRRRPSARHGEAHEPHESPWTMYLPLVVLAGLSVVGGLIDLPFTKRQARLPRSVARASRGGAPETGSSQRRRSCCRPSRSSSAWSASWWGVAVYRNGLRDDGNDPTTSSARWVRGRARRTRGTSTSGSLVS